MSKKEETPKAKVLFWDIETRSLVGDYGSIICIGWMWEGEKKPHVKSIVDIPGKHPLDDKPLVKWFVEKVWNGADIAVGWYTGGHDEPFLRTRSIIHHLPAPKPVTTLDLWGKVWKRFKFSKNSLDNVSRHLGLPTKIWNKTSDFEKSLYGDKKAIKRICVHCARDVVITAAAYKMFSPYILAHPRLVLDTKVCKYCGSKHLQRRGYRFSAAKGKAILVQCQDCSRWDTKLPKELK